MDFEKVIYQKRDRIAYITINRPEVRNCIDPQTSMELNDAWIDFRDDPDVWVAILTGAGDKAFSAGADLKALSAGATGSGKPVRPAPFGGMTRDVEIWKPMIAAINGVCIAGGLEMALACDLRVAAEQAQFGLAEVRWGLIPGAGGTQRLPRSIPLAKAMEIILLAEPIDAQEAHRIGLVNMVVPADQVMAVAEGWANTILERGPLAVRAAKESILRGRDMSLNEGLRFEALQMLNLRHTDDFKEGPRAFAEKRKPNFQGR